MDARNNPNVMQELHEGSKKKMSEKEKRFNQTFGVGQYTSQKVFRPDMKSQYGQNHEKCSAKEEWFKNRQQQEKKVSDKMKHSETDAQETVVAENPGTNLNDEKLSEVLVQHFTDKSEEEKEKDQKNKRLSCYQITESLLETDDWRTEDGMLLHYEKDRGYWRLIPKSNENRELRSSIDMVFAPDINKSTLSEVYEWLAIWASPFPSAKSAMSTSYINLLDAAVDWQDGCTMVRERKKMYFRYYLNISSDDLQKARNNNFKKYLETVYPDDKETKREFKKFLGIALSGFRDEKMAVILHGPSSTGKSVFLNLLGKLMGEELTASVSFSQISQEFTMVQLLGKSLSTSGEISGTNNKRLDVFKSITGRDKLTLCYKAKDYFQTRFHCLLVFASNVFPQIADIRELNIFLQRVQIFPFDNVIPRSKWIANLEDELYEDRGTILEMAMEGLREWEADKHQFKESKAMREKKMEFKRESNSFEVFLETYACTNSKSRVTHQEINRRYEEFCMQEGLIPLAGNVWPTVLKEIWPVKPVIIETRDPNTLEVTRNRGYQGIELFTTPYGGNVSSQIFGVDKQNW